MSEHPWWQSAVIYQIYPRSFQDSNGDGIGDLPGVTARLDYLATTLGVDAMWLSPFYVSPMRDFGYDVADYCDVDPIFGTLDDFDEMLRAAHERGLRVIIDFVPNHSSAEHPWFAESRAARNSAKRDWYVWREARPDGSPPNNWLSVFGGPAWTLDAGTGQYYLHSFLPSQPDLNWRNPDVEKAMLGAARFWLDRGVDGFRLDVAHFIMKDPELRDNPPAVPAAGGVETVKDMGAYGSQDHRHDKGHPDVHAVFRRFRTMLDEYGPDRYSVAEIHIFDWEEWASYYGDLDELHQPFNFSLLFAEWSAPAFRRLIEAEEAALPDGAWPNHVLGNHDEVRLASRFGPRRARAAAVLLLTLRGTPTLYYGDELGMEQATIERQQDPWGRRVPGLGRDGCRTPMQWSPGPCGGFTVGLPWLPVGPHAGSLNVETQLADPDSLLNLYRALLELRRRSAALRLGSVECLDIHRAVLSYRRSSGEQALTVHVNMSDEPVTVGGPGRSVVLATHGDRRRETAGGGLTLAPNEGVVLR